jgi:hypothetical protein
MNKITEWIDELCDRNHYVHPWSYLIFVPPAAWFIPGVPDSVKVIAVAAMIAGFALARGPRRWYAVLVFVYFDWMGHVSWLARFRPNLLFGAMLLAWYLDLAFKRERPGPSSEGNRNVRAKISR